MSTIRLFDENRTNKSIRYLEDFYPDYLVNNNLEITNYHSPLKKQKIIKQSVKRSSINGVVISNSEIINSAFSGSFFQDTEFNNDHINGNSFVCSVFKHFKLQSESLFQYASNNFSQSYFEECQFVNSEFINSTWLNSEIIHSEFENCRITSCTLEGTIFRDCMLKDVEMGNANLDYMIIKNSKLMNVVFPFYQFAYIIGIEKYIKEINKENKIVFKAGNKVVSLDEYKRNIENLMYYYYERNEYFPICNLFYSIGDIRNASKFLLIGISQALDNSDFRLIRHFCKMGKFYSLLDYDTTNKIKSRLDTYLKNKTFSNNELNQTLIKISEINNLLNEKTMGKTFLQIELQTNVDREDSNSQEKIENLISDCRFILQNPIFALDGHTISEINYCPITLSFTILGAIANLATIAGVLQQYFVSIKTIKTTSSRSIAQQICEKYKNIHQVDIDTRIKLAKSEIEKSMLEVKYYKGQNSGKKYDSFIENITQKIIGDVQGILDKEMLVFSIS